MIEVNSDIVCNGCGACKQICPQKCIEMIADDEGFLYPQKDENRCNGCNLCEKICFIKNERKSITDYDIYGVKNKDEKIRYESSSGGMFSCLAERVINDGGVVFGAAYDENFNVVHTYAEDIKGLARFRKSKYVQSDIKDTYIEAEKFLQDGRKVLYSGCPCQIAGLKSYLGKEYDNLICIDLICLGVSSPAVFRSYAEAVQTRENAKIESVTMREKHIDNIVLKPNHPNITLKVKFDNGRELYQYSGFEESQNPFFAGFLSRLYLRPSCHDCKARRFSSGSDIQLGDFWGIENVNPNFCDKDENGGVIPFGVSEVILKSDKGKRFFDGVSGKLEYFKLDKDWFLQSKSFGNYFLLHDSFEAHYSRDHFFEDYKKNKSAVIEIIRKYLNIPQKNTAFVPPEYTVCRDLSYKLIIGRKIDRYLLEHGFKNIAIYGYGDIGFLIDKALRDSEVDVKFLIDKSPVFSDKRVMSASDPIPNTIDAIVMCVPHANTAIEAFLKAKTDLPLIPVSDLIYYA